MWSCTEPVARILTLVWLLFPSKASWPPTSSYACLRSSWSGWSHTINGISFLRKSMYSFTPWNSVMKFSQAVLELETYHPPRRDPHWRCYCGFLKPRKRFRHNMLFKQQYFLLVIFFHCFYSNILSVLLVEMKRSCEPGLPYLTTGATYSADCGLRTK